MKNTTSGLPKIINTDLRQLVLEASKGHPFIYLFKELWDSPKGGSSSRSTGHLALCCRETGEYHAMRNCSCTPITGPPKLSSSWQFRGGGRYKILGKWNKRQREKKKRAHEHAQLPTSLAAFTNQFREGKVYLHLKCNLTKSYKQKAFSNYAHSVMET